jgi:ATP-dependent DNA ligase
MYDVYDGIDLKYSSRRGKLLDLFITHDISNLYYKIVDTTNVISFEQINFKLQEYIEQGFEGQMLRDPNTPYENKRSNGLLKHKTFFDEEFTIIGYAEGIGKFSGKVATLKVNVNGVEVDCTINGTMEYLEELFQIKDTLIGKQATVKYFEKTVDGSLRFPKVIAIRDYE